MPTYEYACKGCGEHLEVVQSFKDDALTECPGCGGTLRKVFSAAGIIFKGSGWHIKDYASSKGAANPAAGGSSSSDDPSKVKSDSATASSSDAPSGSGSSESKTSDGSGTSSASGSEGSSSASAGSSSSSEKKSA